MTSATNFEDTTLAMGEGMRIAAISVHGCPYARLGEKDTGGMNVYVLHLARELGKRGIAVDVYTRVHDLRDPVIFELGPNARVIHLRAGAYGEPKENLYRHLPEFVANLCGYWREIGVSFDVLHTHYWLSGWVGLLLRGHHPIPWVANFHTLGAIKRLVRPGERESERRIQTEQRVLLRADTSIALNPHERAEMVRLHGADPQRVRVIPAGVDTDLFQPVDRAEARRRLGLGQDAPLVLYVGRLEKLKGIDILLQVAALLGDTPGLRLLVVGGNPSGDRERARLEAEARKLGIAHMVRFEGPVKQEALPVYYSAADVCIVPSYYESFGLVAVESQACGTPVVAARAGGLAYTVRDGVTGYLIPDRRAELYADRIRTLLTDAPLRARMGDAARKAVAPLTWGAMAERFGDVYRDVTASVPPSDGSPAGAVACRTVNTIR
ncbi:MAG: glycosyltransferase [Chloroflexota bacterium]